MTSGHPWNRGNVQVFPRDSIPPCLPTRITLFPISPRSSKKLEDRFGLHVWKDNWELSGGDDWVEKLPEAISSSRSVMAFVGPNGIGPWHREEIKVALQRAVRDKSIRVIPVALAGSPARLDLPAFVDSKQIVDVRIVDDWSLLV